LPKFSACHQQKMRVSCRPAKSSAACSLKEPITSADTGRGDDELLRDGETYRITAAFRIGIAPDLELGVDLPYLNHEYGRFDGLINNFHEKFGIGGNSRSQVADNRLTYTYIRKGSTRFQISEPVSGPGDVMLHGAYQFYHRSQPASRAVALRVSLKLPTGQAEKLTGSGGFDLSMGIAGSDALWLAAYRVTFYGMIGGLYLGDGDVLPELQRHLAPFGHLGIGWQPVNWLAIRLQIDARGAFFKHVGFRPLDSWAAQLVGGFSFNLPAATFLDLALLENIFVETAPDVALHIALRKEF
jgi:hypothetical protein